MSKRFFKSNNSISSPAKKQKIDSNDEPSISKERTTTGTTAQQNVQSMFENDDIWGEEFDEKAIEEMDFTASQATQEEAIFKTPMSREISNSSQNLPSNSMGLRIFDHKNHKQTVYGFNQITQSQILGSSEERKEIIESTQAIFNDFENEIKQKSLNSTFRSRQDSPSNNVVLLTDDDQVEKWKEEKKKLLEDFMTKEGETEYLRQKLNQIETRAEHDKKEQARLMEEQTQKFRAELSALRKEKTVLESQLQLQQHQLSTVSEKCKLLESGSIKFTQPQVNMIKANKDRSNSTLNSSMNWPTKKVKTKEAGIQAKTFFDMKSLKTTLIKHPLRIPQCAFEPPEPEKSVVDIKIEEKIGKRHLAIIQEEETFRIFENPELSKPKVTVVNGRNLSTEFVLTDLGKLMNKTESEINVSDTIPILNKLIATTRELLLNSTLVLQNISQALQNDDLRDMNELYASDFYERPVAYTKSFCEASAWHDLERGVETRRAVGILAHIAKVSTYLADYVAGNVKLKTNRDPNYQSYASQMKSYEAWSSRGFEFEFLNMILEFVTVVGTIRRAHQFTGLINAILILICNVQTNVGFSELGIKRICTIFKEIVYSRPLLACFVPMCNILKEFSQYSSFVNKLCINPDKSGINYWKGTLNFSTDACALEIFIFQLEHFKLDPITLINIINDLVIFSNNALMQDSVPWLEQTKFSCNCCLNLLKFVVTIMCECTKIKVDELNNRMKCAVDSASRNAYKQKVSKKNNVLQKNASIEDNKNLMQNYSRKFLNDLKIRQFSAVSNGIRLLSFLAKRDLDFMIRVTNIEDAFHQFLTNLDERRDFNIKLKASYGEALDIVRKTFVLEKTKEESRSSHKDIDNILNDEWTGFTSNSYSKRLCEENINNS